MSEQQTVLTRFAAEGIAWPGRAGRAQEAGVSAAEESPAPGRATPEDSTTAHENPVAGADPSQEDLDEETVDGLPVLAEVRPLAPAPTALPAVQAAAAAATGFVAGAAALALVHRHATRRARRTRRRQRPAGAPEALEILATRRFLLDVHLIGQPES